MRKQPFDLAEIRPPIGDLLLNAISKTTTLPLVVFVEVNLPPEELPTWVPHVKQVADEIASERGSSPFGAVFFTNRPHLYPLPMQPDPSKRFYASGLANGQPFPSLGSREKPAQNADGSTDLYLGPKAPTGNEGNWLATVPGRGYFAIIRLYGPTEAALNKSWKPGDIENVK
jgi:hypothetical protein